MGRILVVDDDSTSRNSVRRILEREGYAVHEADNVESALEALKEQSFDLMVCDYRMPGKSGLDLLSELRQIHSRMPVLMVSAFADAETEKKARHLGAIGLLHKPFRRQELLNIANKFENSEIRTSTHHRGKVMIHIKNILVPVDFSAPSEKAFKYGLSLAQQFHARLTVAHVAPSLASFDYRIGSGGIDLEKLALDSAQHHLEQFISAESSKRVEIRTMLKIGDVRGELLRIIDDEKIDMVVMGSHGRRNLEKFFLGSTTEHLLRKVPVPVLTVSHPEPQSAVQEPAPFRRIVYATDISENAEIGLSYTAELARAFNARLTLLHTVDLAGSNYWAFGAPGVPAFDYAALKDEALQRLQQILKSEQTSGIEAEAIVLEGAAHSTIADFVKESNADLLVLNLQSKGILERVMLGATAERVIRSSHVPVLAIPVDTASRFMQFSSAA